LLAYLKNLKESHKKIVCFFIYLGGRTLVRTSRDFFQERHSVRQVSVPRNSKKQEASLMGRTIRLNFEILLTVRYYYKSQTHSKQQLELNRQINFLSNRRKIIQIIQAMQVTMAKPS